MLVASLAGSLPSFLGRRHFPFNIQLIITHPTLSRTTCAIRWAKSLSNLGNEDIKYVDVTNISCPMFHLILTLLLNHVFAYYFIQEGLPGLL